MWTWLRRLLRLRRRDNPRFRRKRKRDPMFTVRELEVYLQAYWPQAKVHACHERPRYAYAQVELLGCKLDLSPQRFWEPYLTASDLARQLISSVAGRRLAVKPSCMVRAPSFRTRLSSKTLRVRMRLRRAAALTNLQAAAEGRR